MCARPRGATRVPESPAGAVTDASSGRVALVEAVFRPFWAKLVVQKLSQQIELQDLLDEELIKDIKVELNKEAWPRSYYSLRTSPQRSGASTTRPTTSARQNMCSSASSSHSKGFPKGE